MEELRLRLATREDWRKYHDGSRDGIVFCPTQTPPAVGVPVRVELLFQNGPRVRVRGVVVWRRATIGTQVRPGAGVKVAPTDRGTLLFVDSWAQGAPDRRARRRLAVKLQVTYQTREGRRVNFTHDLHEDGALVACAESLPIGEQTKLQLSPPGGKFAPLEVTGKVVRTTEDGRGMGLAFVFADEDQKRRFAEFVARVEAELR